MRRLACLALSCGLLALGLARGASAAEDPKVYALFVFDTDIEGPSADVTQILGSGVKVDRNLLMRAFVKSFDEDDRRHRLEYAVLSGSNVTAARIFDYYKNLHSTPEDTLVFFYSGHGAEDTNLGHYLDLTHGPPMYRSNLRGIMERNPNKLAVIMTNCCSSVSNTTAVIEPAKKAANWEVMQQLFFWPTGLIDFTAALPGTEAFIHSNLGGYFSEAVMHHLCAPAAETDADASGALTWDEFATAVNGRVQGVHQQGQEVHRYFLSDTAPVLFRERRLVVENKTSRDIKVFVDYHTFTEKGEWTWLGSRENGRHWLVPAGATTTLGDAPPEDFVIRGDLVEVRAESVDGQVKFEKQQLEMTNQDLPEYVPADGNYELVPFSFTE